MFITFEGPDGSGKTTQISRLIEHLTGQGHRVCQVREPGGTPIGEQIRQVLHSHSNQEMVSQAEILLYSASRAQLVSQIITPALEEGKVVICDRFYDSTLAYQGYGRQLDLAVLRQITAFATGGLTPDLTLYLDINPQTGLQRRQQDHAAEWNRLDAAQIDFHQRVHEGYRRLMAEEPDRWVSIDANRDVEVVQQDILAVVEKRIAQRMRP